MRARKLLLTSVMCGGLVAASGIGSGALAAAGKVLQPNSDWAISKLAAAQTGGAPYCALARRFSNNLILTMARNGQDETSVAIDFQKQALNNSQSYLITLKPGFGQERSFNVRPVSGKALVIRIGQDYAFHDALNRSGRLDVDISGESYAFSMSDYSEGQHKMGQCLAELVEPAAGQPDVMRPAPVRKMPVVPVSASAETASGNGMNTAPVAPAVAAAPAPSPVNDAQLQALREENLRLRNALERERRNYEDRYMREGQTSSLVAELSEKVNILQMENQQLSDQLKYQPEPESCVTGEPEMLDWSTDPAFERELSSLKDENLSIKQELAAMQAKNAMLEKQLAEKPAVDPAAVAAVESLRERLASLEEENGKLKATNASYEQGGVDVPVSLAQLRAVEDQLRSVKRDRDSLLGQIEAMRQGKSNGLLDISTDNWNLEQATKRFNEAEREIHRLGRELEEQRMQCSSQKKELEYMLFDPSVATKEQIARLTALEDTVREAKADLEAQKIAFGQQLASLKTEAENATMTLDIQRAEYEQKLAVLKDEMKGHEQEVAQSRQQLASMEKQLSEKSQSMSAEAESQIAALKLQLEKVETDRTVMAAQKAEYEQKIAMLEQQRITNEELAASSRQRIALLEKELENARQVASVNGGAKQQVEDRIVALVKKNEDLVYERNMLEQELQDVRKMALAGEGQTEQVDAKIASLMVENEQLIHERNMLEQERNRLSDQSHLLSQKISSLESSLANIQTAAGNNTQMKAIPAGLPAPVAAEPIDVAAGSSAYKDFGNVMEQTVAAAAPSASLMNAAALKTVLGHASIPVQGNVQRDSEGARDFVAYSWNSGSLYGSAEQQIMASPGQYDEMVGRYLAKTKARCQGDFASVPVVSERNGSMHISSHEIACIGAQGGASASVVFYNDGVKFTAIAHETGIDNMEAAMDVRDNLVGSLMQAQVASR